MFHLIAHRELPTPGSRTWHHRKHTEFAAPNSPEQKIWTILLAEPAIRVTQSPYSLEPRGVLIESDPQERRDIKDVLCLVAYKAPEAEIDTVMSGLVAGLEKAGITTLQLSDAKGSTEDDLFFPSNIIIKIHKEDVYEAVVSKGTSPRVVRRRGKISATPKGEKYREVRIYVTETPEQAKMLVERFSDGKTLDSQISRSECLGRTPTLPLAAVA